MPKHSDNNPNLSRKSLLDATVERIARHIARTIVFGNLEWKRGYVAFLQDIHAEITADIQKGEEGRASMMIVAINRCREILDGYKVSSLGAAMKKYPYLVREEVLQDRMCLAISALMEIGVEIEVIEDRNGKTYTAFYDPEEDGDTDADEIVH